jgi:acylphosphatase
MIRRRVVVQGIVQGVFFRASCQQEASRRGVAGWVINRRDGAVEAAFEGEDEAVEQMIAWMRRGPRSAVVESVDVSEEEPEGETRFDVR